MRIKKLLPSVLLLVLIAILSTVLFVHMRANDQAMLQQSSEKDLLTYFDPGDVFRIHITHADGEILMEKDDDNKWFEPGEASAAIDAKKIDAQSITDLRTTFQDAAVRSRVTDSAEQLDRYGLDQEHSYYVRVEMQDNPLADTEILVEAYIGSAGSTPNTFYMQFINNPTVLLVSGNRSTIVHDNWYVTES